MFKYTATYKDFNGVQHTEDLYFHMMAPEFAELEFNPTFDVKKPDDTSGLSAFIKDAMSSGDGRKIYIFFKLMMANSYGRRSEDGSKFTKKPEWTEEFLNSLAYEDFFVWLINNPKNAEAFWNGIMPERLSEIVGNLEAEREKTGETKKKITELSREELIKLYQQKVAAPAVEA